VAFACPAGAATQYRSIRAWVDEGSAKVPLACKPSEVEAGCLAAVGNQLKSTDDHRCSNRARLAELRYPDGVELAWHDNL